MKKQIYKVGFPLNEDSALLEPYASLSYKNDEVQIAQTGLPSIINALKFAISSPELKCSMSLIYVIDLLAHIEEIQCDIRNGR